MKKLYVLIRKDLSPSQQAVQAGHAVAEFCRRFPVHSENEWQYGTLVYLGVEDLVSLLIWRRKLDDGDNIPVAEYKEPFYNNQMTAFAILGEKDIVESVKELKLI